MALLCVQGLHSRDGLTEFQSLLSHCGEILEGELKPQVIFGFRSGGLHFCLEGKKGLASTSVINP